MITFLHVHRSSASVDLVDARVGFNLPTSRRRRLDPLQDAVRFRLREGRKAERMRVAAADNFVRGPDLSYQPIKWIAGQ